MGMPNAVKLFPRGYGGGQALKKRRFTVRGGDAEVSELWEQYTSPNNQSTQWSFRRKVIECAKRMFSDNRSWFIQQDDNPFLDDYNYQFVVDTLRFIATGRRRISIHTWPDLMTHSHEAGLSDVTERREIAKAFHEFKLNTGVDELLQLWLQRPRGFDDLMNTLNILFGDLPLRIDESAS